MRRSIALILFTAATFVAASGFTGCHRRHRSPEEMTRHLERHAVSHVEDLLDDVDANEAQRTRILGHVGPLVRRAAELHAAHRGDRDTLTVAWASANPDAEMIHGTIDRFGSDVTGFLHAVADAVLDAHATLDAEQRREILEELD